MIRSPEPRFRQLLVFTQSHASLSADNCCRDEERGKRLEGLEYGTIGQPCNIELRTWTESRMMKMKWGIVRQPSRTRKIPAQKLSQRHRVRKCLSSYPLLRSFIRLVALTRLFYSLASFLRLVLCQGRYLPASQPLPPLLLLSCTF